MNLNPVPVQFFFRWKPIQKCVHCCNYSNCFPSFLLYNRTQYFHTFPCQKCTLNIRMIKQKISCRIKPYIFLQYTPFFISLLCFFFPGKNDDSVLKAIAQCIHQMRLLRTDAARNLKNSFCLSPLSNYFLIIRQFFQRFQKSQHIILPSSYDYTRSSHH